MKASAKDLRNRTKEILAAVERGEEVVVTYRGEEKARIKSARKAAEKPVTEGGQFFGFWKENDLVQDVQGFIDQLRGDRFGAR